MAEDFPDDSFFRNSNVALLDAACASRNDNSKSNGRCGKPQHNTEKIINQPVPDTAVLKFTTAKDVLNALRKEEKNVSACKSILKGTPQDVDNLPEYSKNAHDDVKSHISINDQKLPSKCKSDEPCSKTQKNKSEIKDKIKAGYRPLNITKNVASGSKQSLKSNEDDLITSEDGGNLLSFSSNGESKDGPDDSVSLITTQEKLQLSSWGLPSTILHQYAKRGITSMFPWQVECLSSPQVLNGRNLVYSAPTSAGKTLVAEILCIKAILERHKKALFILPFISVVREKMFYFQELLRGSGVRVDGFMGGHSPPGGFKAIDLAICTIEKANSLVNRLMEDEGLADLGAVIVDELHLIGDSHRGYLLELLLTKLKFMSSKEHGVSIQIVGMSATLPNLSLLSTWLDADLYRTSFRPIPLEEFVKIGSVVYNKNMQPVRTVLPEIEIKNDTENIIYLCLETIAGGHSVLIFCPTKSWCESLAQTIAAQFKSIGLDRDVNAPESLPYKLREQLNATAIAQALEQLQRCPVGLDSILRKVVSFGVAFHHAGLTMDERDIVEGCFRNGTLRVLVATSTLSSGVNLPARRVVIRTPMFHSRPIDILAYRQMIGRAGRMGVDSAGESFLICQTVEKRIAENLLKAQLTPIESCLGRGSLSASLKRAILEVIASKVATTPKDVDLYANCTLLAAGLKEGTKKSDGFLFNSSDGSNPISSCVEFLHQNELIRLQTGEDGITCYTPTALGQACLSASLPPDEGLLLFKELERARQCFVLENELHILYQVTPFNVAEQWGNLDWLQVLALWEQLPADLKRVGDLVGVEDRFIVRAMRGTINANSEKQRMKLMIHRRFYASLALHDLVNEVPLNTVASKFNCSRGVLQSLQQSASTYAGMVTSFCHRLGWSSLELLIDQFQDRLHFGTHRDLLDLLRLPSLNGPRARALFNVGLTTVVELTTADVLVVENALQSAVPFISEKERDGESTFETEHRRKLKGIWITGRQGLTEREAAELIIEEARTAVQMELGVKCINWEKAKSEEKSMEITLPNASSTIIRKNVTNDELMVQAQCETMSIKEGSDKIVSNSSYHGVNDLKVTHVFNNLACMDMSKKLNSKVKRIIESIEQQQISHVRADESLKDSDSVIEKKSAQLEATILKLEYVNNEEKENQAGSESNSPRNKISDTNLRLVLNPSSTSLSPTTPYYKEQNLNDKIVENEVLIRSRRASIDMFECSISNTVLAELDYTKLDLSDTPHDSISDLNNGCINSSNWKESTPSENHLDASCNTKIGGSCMADDTSASAIGKVSQRESINISCCSVPELSKSKLSADLFAVSPSQDASSPIEMSAATLNKESPSSHFCRVESKQESLNHSRGLFSSPLLKNSPEIMINDRSPSLFGDSFEMDSNILNIADGNIVDDQAALKESSEKSVGGNQDFLKDEKHDVYHYSQSESSTSVHCDSSFIDVEGNTCLGSFQNAESCTSIGNSQEMKGTDCTVSLDEPLKSDRENNPSKGTSLHLGVRRKPLKRKSSKDTVNHGVKTVGHVDSFLGAVFQSAYEFNELLSTKRTLRYSLERESGCVMLSNIAERNAGQNEMVSTDVRQNEGRKDSFLSMNCDAQLIESPKKKLKLQTTSVSDFSEDVVLSSQESVTTHEKTLRKSSRSKAVQKRNYSLSKNCGTIKSSQINLLGDDIYAIGPPLSRKLLQCRQEKSFHQKPTCSEKLRQMSYNFRNVSGGSDICNPFETGKPVDWSSFNIIDICGNINLFNTFVQTMSTVKTFSMSLACDKHVQETKPQATIGSRIVKKTLNKDQDQYSIKNDPQILTYGNISLVGVSFCFGGTDAYFVSLQNDAREHSISLQDRLKLLKEIVGCRSLTPARTICCFDLKEQFKVLFRCTSIEIGCLAPCDPKVADWLLEPEGKEKNLQALVVAYLEEASGFAAQVGNVRGGAGSPALDVEQTRIPARKRASLEAILSWNLLQVQHKSMAEKGLLSSFTQVEMPVLLSVARMELNGIIFDSCTAELLRDKLVRKMEDLQEQCYKLAGHPFSLTSPADTAKVLYNELKLKPKNMKKMGSKSTSKEALLRLCDVHPLPGAILLWRKINAVVVKCVSPLLQPENTNRILGQYVFHTATGRLLMREPNLQNIPRDFDISSGTPEIFSLRTAFVPAKGNLFVAADYSQLELRILAHLSDDSKLRNILNSNLDVFCCIAASWHNISEEEVTDQLRQRAKQMCYGILYGMGVTALAEQLEVEESEASTLREKFRVAYPGVQIFVTETIEFCRKNGYVKTLLGRYRQLPAIASPNLHVRAHAERQAVNTTVQGSAADIVKSAMVDIEKALHRCGDTPSSAPRIVLHLHDELVYEVSEESADLFVELLQSKMENAVSLSVKLPVKVKKGSSWGTLERA